MNKEEAKKIFSLIIEDIINEKVSFDDAREEMESELLDFIDDKLYNSFLSELEDMEQEYQQNKYTFEIPREDW